MKVQIGFKMAVAALILALAVIPGLARGLPAAASPASASGGFIWFTKTVDSTGDRGTHTSIAFHPTSGTPWISYYDEGNGDLMVAHRVSSGGNCGPNDEWYCETVDSSGNVGQYSSIDVYVNPHVACGLHVGVAYFYPAYSGALKFAEYSCNFSIPCTCSWSTEIVNFTGTSNRGYSSSIRYDSNGTPHIAYYDDFPEGLDSLGYAKRVSGGWELETVDFGEGRGQYASLDLAYIGSSIIPYIAYYDGAAGDLKYAYRSGSGMGNCGSGNNWNCFTLDSSSDVGQSVSFRWGEDLHFAYYDATHGKLRYARSVGSGGGNCGPGNSFLCYTIEDAASPSGYRNISLAVDSAGNPLIAYRYASGFESRLRVAQLTSDLLSANCGLPDGGLFFTWQCFTIDAESGLGHIASHVSADFDPDDLPMIAYSEWFYNPIGGSGAYDLKIAYGRIGVFLPLVLRNSP